MRKELSIFIDESGDFGPYQSYCPFYLVTFLFHDQRNKINDQLKIFTEKVSYLNLPLDYIHIGPLIRNEDSYAALSLESRRKAIEVSINFIRKMPIKYHTFFVDRSKAVEAIKEIDCLSSSIEEFLRINDAFFSEFDYVKIYYDNGQKQLSKMLFEVISRNVKTTIVLKEIKSAKEYILLQMADVLCGLELVNYKISKNIFSHSENVFFTTKKHFSKDYYKKIECKKI